MLAGMDSNADVSHLDRVSCTFDHAGAPVTALDDVTLHVSAGEFVAIMGATGSGKSTLLHCAGGLIRPRAGEVRLTGRRIDRLGERALTRLRRDRVGFVFQSYNLLSKLSVAQNVMLPRRLGAKRGRPLDELLAAVDMADAAGGWVGGLSGGQRQRVAIARALSTRPQVVFADEPTGALDPTTGARVLALLRTAVDAEGVAVIMVTHDPAAAALSDRLLLLDAGRLVDDRPTPDAATISALLAAVCAPADLVGGVR